MADDPFGELGLTDDATADDVRGARRRLAKEHHPDRGGDPSVMRALNDAAAAALRRIARPPSGPQPHPASGAPDERDVPDDDPVPACSDAPSFTVEALPVETFEALLLVAATIGETLDDEPPYRLDAVLGPPMPCWCRLDLVPDAGATTVSLAIAAIDGSSLPTIERVRDLWVDGLNRLDWDDAGPRP